MLNHQKLLKASNLPPIWTTKEYNIILHPFPCNLHWFSDMKVLTKIVIVVLVASTLIIPPASDRNNTKPKMAKATTWYLSSPNFPSSLFVFNLSSISFHLKLPLVVLYWPILSKYSNLVTTTVVSNSLFEINLIRVVWEIQNLSILINSRGHVNVSKSEIFVIWVPEMQ